MKNGREISYIMSREMYDALRAEAPKNVNPKNWLIQYVNDTFGFLGTVTEIQVEG